MLANLARKELVFVALENALREAADRENQMISAIPDDVSVDEEAVLLEAAWGPAFALASYIDSLPAESEAGSRVKAMAGSYLAGNYSATYGYH